jgi:hypothetical protein
MAWGVRGPDEALPQGSAPNRDQNERVGPPCPHACLFSRWDNRTERSTASPLKLSHRQFLPRDVRSFDCLKGPSVATIVISMIVILGLAVGTVGLVLVGMQGRGRGRVPRLAHGMARAAQHLNGDAKPPARLVHLIQASVAAGRASDTSHSRKG